MGSFYEIFIIIIDHERASYIATLYKRVFKEIFTSRDGRILTNKFHLDTELHKSSRS